MKTTHAPDGSGPLAPFDARQTVAGTRIGGSKVSEMLPGPHVDTIARLLADRSRAVMLNALLDGRQWTGRELASAAGVTPSTASTHLQRLVDGDVVSALDRGRHKYYRISRPDVAHALETLMTLAPVPEPRHARAIDVRLRRLRTCYDHLAGQVAVQLAAKLVARGAVVFEDEAAYVTVLGNAMFASLGIVIDGVSLRRPPCRPCLDWSERRYHLAGRVGVALARFAFERGYVVREEPSRALAITAAGQRAFHENFGVETDATATQPPHTSA